MKKLPKRYLVDLYDEGDAAFHLEVLYNLLKERPASANISHKKMPTWKQHCDFVLSQPYREWFLIYCGDTPVGAIYLSPRNEIGIGIFRDYQREGHATWAIKEMVARHKKEVLYANIAPSNLMSERLFSRLGFELCQYTYRLASPRRLLK